MTNSQNTFKCVIISPAGRLLDCSAVSVVFVAHDGSVGVMSNHMPMLCELGLGIMKIEIPSDAGRTGNENTHKKLALIDGGFALVHSNMINIIAVDAVCQWDISKEKAEYLLEKSKKKLQSIPEKSEQYTHLSRKKVLIERLFS